MGSCKSGNCADCTTVVVEIVDKNGRDERNLIPILHAIQKSMGYVSTEVMETVAAELGVPVSRVHGVATFYTLFYTKPRGKYMVRLCDSPPCHIEGSKAVREAISKELGIRPGETTSDGNFTFEIVSCMGLCGVAPAIMINDDVYGNLKPEVIHSILAKYKPAGTDASGSFLSRSAGKEDM